MNQITVSFTECSPAPANGYNILWRVAGSTDPYNDAGNFANSPAVIQDDTNPAGTQYEGIIRSDCTESGDSGINYGNPIDWTTVIQSGSGIIAGVGEIYGLDCAEASTIENILFNDEQVPLLTGSYPVMPGQPITLQSGVTGTGVLTVLCKHSPLFRTNSVRATDSNGNVQCLEFYNTNSLPHNYVFNDFYIGEEKWKVEFSCLGCV